MKETKESVRDKRRYHRFPAALDATCSVTGTSKKNSCRILDINREGIRVEVSSGKDIAVGTGLRFSIKVPTASASVCPGAHVRWIDTASAADASGVAFGCQFTNIRPKDKWFLLDYAYDNWASAGD